MVEEKSGDLDEKDDPTDNSLAILPIMRTQGRMCLRQRR